MKAKIQAALDELRPYIQADGGDVDLVGVEDNIVTVRLTGHCVGCPSSMVTLKAGIEQHLKKRCPEIVEVRQAPSAAQEAAANTAAHPVHSPFAGGASAAAVSESEKVTDHLRRMHREAERHIDRMETALNRIAEKQHGDGDLRELETAVEFLNVDLMTHMRQEDEVLFPALVPFISWGSPMSVMAKEHNVIHEEIQAMRPALRAFRKSGEGEELVRLGKRLAQRLRDDFFQEENVMFVEADESLTGARAGALREAMERIAAAAERDRN